MFKFLKKSNIKQTPAQFSTELLEDFVDLATKEGYLHGTSPIVPEIMKWGAHSFLRAIKNTDKISLTDINIHYMYVGMLNFIYASCITETWNENFILFEKTDYKVNGLEEDFEHALNKMLLTFSKINGEIPTTQEFTDFFIKLSEIFNRKMIPYFNVSDRIQKDYIFAGMSSYYTLGMAIKLKSVGYDNKCESQLKNDLSDGVLTVHTLLLPDGEKYEGQFMNSKYNGMGTYYYSCGDKYVGEWLNNKKDGMGTLYWSNGNKYIGKFKNDYREGIGTYYYVDGQKYEGEFKKEKREGIGTYSYLDGSRYEGNWLNGNPNGTGTEYNSDGSINFKGEWVNGGHE